MTLKISALRYGLRNGEVNSLTQAILNKSTLFTLETDAYLLNIIGGLQEQQTNLNEAIHMLRTKSELLDLSAKLKKSYRSLYKMVEAFVRMEGYEMAEEANLLFQLLMRYNKSITYSKNQLDVNSYVSSLLADFELERYENALFNLPFVSAMVSDLADAQQVYLSGFADYQNQHRLEMEQTTAYVLKNNLVRFINEKLVLHLNAMLQVAPADYLDFSRAVGAIIEERNMAVKMRLNQLPVLAKVA